MKFNLRKIPDAHRDLIEFGMETGVRPGELVSLKVKDLDTRNGGRMMIGRTVSAYTHILERTKGKTPEVWLFINPDTKRRYSVKMPNTLWKRHAKLDVTYYEASRHSFCTQLVDDGVDALQAKSL